MIPTPAPPSARRRILAWCLFDFANSPYTTLVVTFVYSTYFIKAFAPDPVLGTVWWSRAVALAALVVALASPVLGAAADRGGLRVRFLGVTTVVCVTATALLTFVRPDAPNAALLALALVVLADIGFELGMVFYNALLPGLAPSRAHRPGFGERLGAGISGRTAGPRDRARRVRAARRHTRR